jgi:hypothetical protein
MQPEHDPLAWNEFLRAGFCDEVAVPIAAVSEEAIARYIGKIERVVSEDSCGRRALVVNIYPRENSKTLLVFDLPESDIFFSPQQVWVHVDLRNYRAAYLKSAIEQALPKATVLDHVMNRKVARVLGFEYIRTVPVPPRINSEHGSLNETWELKDMLGNEAVLARRMARRGQIRYADWADLVKMLKIRTGGRRHPELLETLPLFEERRPSS